METLLSFYQSGRNNGNFDSGIQIALQRILSSPQFVFRFERDPANIGPDTPYRVSDLELASRLSFFLWSSIPDDELLTLASQGKLKDPAVYEKQVRRMLADPRSDTLVTNFASQWLYLRNLESAVPNIDLFPDFDDNLRQAFRQETELFFRSVLREDRNVLDLLNGDYTFVNAFHGVSHHGDDLTKLQRLSKINTYHVQLLAYFLQTLQSKPDGEGSLLDHTLVMYGSSMGNPNEHNHAPVPIVLAGGASGRMQTGRHLKTPDRTSTSNLLLTVLNKAGIPTEKMGDSSGELDV